MSKKDIAQSVFEKNFQQLPESKKEIINEKYNCSICLELIKYENPFLCYVCQKIFHHACLKSWDTRQRQLGNELSCPNCRNALPFEQWKEQRNHDENRTKDAEILNQIGKSFNSDEYTDKSQSLFKLIVNKLNGMHSLLEFEKNYKLDNLIEEFKSKVSIPSINDISTVIIEELELLEEYIGRAKKKEDELIVHKDEINIKYMVEKEGRQKIFGDYFADFNSNYLSLIINGKKYPLVNEYNLKKGENNVTLCIKHKLKNLSHMFYFCKALYNINELKYLDTEEVTDFSHMFGNCDISDIKPLEKWNISKAKNLCGIFESCELLTNIKPLENWNVSNCKDFSYMFQFCKNLSNIKPLENWNVSNCINFSHLFYHCNISDIKPLTNWNVSKGLEFNYMFNGNPLSDIKPLEKWNVSNAIDMRSLFSHFFNLTDIKPLRNWNVSRCKKFDYLFSYCEKLKDLSPIQNWNVSNGTDFYGMFEYCKSLTDLKPISNWNVSNGEYFASMFSNCELLSDLKPIENWNVSNGHGFGKMFGDCKSLKNANVLKKWKFQNNSDFKSMFN